MAEIDSARPRVLRNPILARDENGVEHELGVVDHPHGLISLFDATFIRIIAPGEAIKLAVALLHATKDYCPRRGRGPISSSF